MAISAKAYGLAQKSFGEGKMNVTADTLKCSLHTSGYAPNQDTHQFVSDLTNEVAAGGGYSTGGLTLTSVTWAYDAATNKMKLDAVDPAWSSSTITAAFAVFSDRTPASDATRPLISYVDFGGNIVSTGGPFTVTLDADGFYVNQAA